MDERILRIKRWENGIPTYPMKIEFWPTYRCNLMCKYCRGSNLKQSKLEELFDNRILELIDESANLNIKEWILAGGGEPLIRKKVIEKAMHKIKSYGMRGALTTNGTLFDRNMIKNMVNTCWDVVFFSIDGHNAQTNDFLRKKGTFKKAYQNLKLFQKLKQKDSKPLIGFSSVLTNTNYKYLKRLILLAYDVGCEHIIINPIKGNNTDYNEKLKLNKYQVEELRAEIPNLINLSKELKIKTTLPLLNTDIVEKSSDLNTKTYEDKKPSSFKNVKCYEPWTSILISPEGKIGPCCERPEDSSNVNVKEDNLKDIWFGEYFQKIRKNLLNGIFDDKCFICNAWKLTDTESIRKKI